MQAGFIGLGRMGAPIARNIAKAGHELTVYNRTRAKAGELERDGAKVASSPAEAAASGIVFTMLADDRAAEEVILGNDGVLGGLRAGGIHISFSTISAGLSRRLEEAHHKAGQRYAAAPVFGRPDSAAAAKLVVVAAGDKTALEEAHPIFEVIGQRTFLLGSNPSMANVVKLNGNFLLATMIEAFGEVFAVLRKSGIDPKQFLEIVNGNVFKSPVFQNYGNIIAERRFEPAGFRLKLGLKDVTLALRAAEDVTLPLPLASLLRDRYLAAVARGNGEKDWSAVTAESEIT